MTMLVWSAQKRKVEILSTSSFTTACNDKYPDTNWLLLFQQKPFNTVVGKNGVTHVLSPSIHRRLG